MRRFLLGVGLLLAAAPGRAGVGRAVEIAMPGETPGLRTGSTPGVSLQLSPVNGLAPLLPNALTPSLAAPAPLPAPAMAVAATPAALAPVQASPVKAVDGLKTTGASLAAAKPGSGGDVKALDGLFVGGAGRSGAASVSAGPERAPEAALSPSRPSSSKRMPPGVAKAFKNSAVLGGGMAALGGGLYAYMGAPPLLAFSVIAFPLLLVPLHFALVSAFWASRYYGYPKLGDGGKAAFRSVWSALSVAYPAAALAALTAWLFTIGGSATMLALFGPAFLVAAGEVFHHFAYRGPAERAQDKGKPFLDWRSRLGGNIGQQLSRMRRKP